MGNRFSSSMQTSSGGSPPPLLSAAVLGDAEKFVEIWNNRNLSRDRDDEVAIATIRDGQGNNVLHALFSCDCRGGGSDPNKNETKRVNNCSAILDHIHTALPDQTLQEAYQCRNNLGCTPIWILVAYGNVSLLRQVRQKFDKHEDFVRDLILQQPNNQGDSALLATCSQGNTAMVQYLNEEVFCITTNHRSFDTAITASNDHGTTPLQIIVGNNHRSLLEYILLQQETDAGGEEISRRLLLQQQFLKANKAGLSLFHICSERNGHEILNTILTFVMKEDSGGGDAASDNSNKKKKKNDNNNNNNNLGPSLMMNQVLSLKDKNGANALHVAAFCGNIESVQVWIKFIKEATTCSSPEYHDDDNDNDNDNDNSSSSSSSTSSTDGRNNSKKYRKATTTMTVVMLLDVLDSAGRTAYWLGMVQGRYAIGKLLADEGVDTTTPQMIKEIDEARHHRKIKNKKKSDIAATTTIDGTALLNR